MKNTIKALIIFGFVVLIRVISRFEIEKGICLNDNQDGKLYNREPFYNYISYSGTSAKAGEEIITIEFLNPINNECDDIIFRHDIVIR